MLINNFHCNMGIHIPLTFLHFLRCQKEHLPKPTLNFLPYLFSWHTFYEEFVLNIPSVFLEVLIWLTNLFVCLFLLLASSE